MGFLSGLFGGGDSISGPSQSGLLFSSNPYITGNPILGSDPLRRLTGLARIVRYVDAGGRINQLKQTRGGREITQGGFNRIAVPGLNGDDFLRIPTANELRKVEERKIGQDLTAVQRLSQNAAFRQVFGRIAENTLDSDTERSLGTLASSALSGAAARGLVNARNPQIAAQVLAPFALQRANLLTQRDAQRAGALLGISSPILTGVPGLGDLTGLAFQTAGGVSNAALAASEQAQTVQAANLASQQEQGGFLSSVLNGVLAYYTGGASLAAGGV